MAAPLKPKDAPDLSRFGWEDPFRLNDQLSEDERMMRDSARAHAQEKLAARHARRVPLLVKVSPDLTDEALDEVLEVAHPADLDYLLRAHSDIS